MNTHGINVLKMPTDVNAPITAPVSITFAIGAAPIQSASTPVAPGTPILCRDWNEAVAAVGYSDDWETYKGICEVMYSHFKLYERGPIVICNLLNPATMNANVPAAEVSVVNKKASLPLEAINDASLTVKAQGGTGSPYVKGVDYDAFYTGENLIVETLPDGSAYDEESLNIAYKKATPASVTANVVATGMENIELCLANTGVVPDQILSPGYSDDPMVAAVMTAKTKINGLFAAKAFIDISSAQQGGAKTYQEAINLKKHNNLNDKNQIVCWPMLGNGGKKFHMSTQLAGVMATVDTNNEGIPYESPSNKPFRADSIILEDGSAVTLTNQQANIVEAEGIVTGLRFLNGLVCWGNYTACYPNSADVKDYYIPLSRMFDWVGNTLIRTHWSKLDRPMVDRLIDSIIDSINIWLNGLSGGGYLLGGRVVLSDRNTPEDMRNGFIRVRILLTPPPPLKQVDFELEYDLSPFTALAAQ